MTGVGPIGRLGRYTATHFRVVLIAWLLVAVVLGFFAARVENALSGAGWEASGSQSVQARRLLDRSFHGLSSYGLMTVISSPTKTVSDPSFQRAVAGVERRLRGDRAVSTVLPPTRVCRSLATGTPRSCRPEPHVIRTRWSRRRIA